jgi:hypothetical protein
VEADGAVTATEPSRLDRLKPVARRVARHVLVFLAFGLLAALVSAPVAAEQAVERVRFDDRLGTLPVTVSLTHDGTSTLDTGVLGQIYWSRTGPAGFGVSMRATGPPEAGGSLASYISPRFVQANAQLVGDPDAVATAYGEQFQSLLWRRFLWIELWVLVVAGTAAMALRGRVRFPLRVSTRRQRTALSTLIVGTACLASALVALQLFRSWGANGPTPEAFAMPEIDGLSFSSAEALEIARQVQPFIEKNTDRTRAQSDAYEAAADASLRDQLPRHADGLEPRDGEKIVLAEADPQGSRVGTRVRRAMYPLLQEILGEDAFAMRTISGDISSNGTVAEKGYVEDESTASGEIPTVAVKGDHDTETTMEQLDGVDVIVPEFEVTDIGDLRVVAANDPAFKTLFGGMVVNESGITETELGEMLREETGGEDETDSRIVLFHQPRSVAGYVGIDSITELTRSEGRETRPYDDGIPDLPPGTINVGHYHDADGPWVIWNTDGDEVTWTVVSQLGTSGGVEENPTFNRFSTPFSPPLKTVSIQLQYVNTDTGLQTGYASIEIATDGSVTVTDRIDVGLPGGEPVSLEEAGLARGPSS